MATGSDVPVGTSSFVLTATSGAITHKINVSLMINPLP
jgi:hypothetical protein